ncbi:penicillin acylase family protein [Nocardioides perillae]|uniref:Acyl-homoserine-lactone acylase n=1 Tax=Nocardioides perillae TaxID=1119534 RepID=A0A7Y9RXI5_9ACTN|nr:penicillin acylase family protein [Nocardioides perillae]NYG56568.1 acyl-homoserine-lactone acylase [Nocardioides perillae]
MRRRPPVRRPVAALAALAVGAALTPALVPGATSAAVPAPVTASTTATAAPTLAGAAAGPAAAVDLDGRADGRGPRYRATVTRTRHGIPHITARTWGSLGYGSGFATAETHICNLADTVLTGQGRRSRWFGATARYDDQVAMNGTNLQVDTLAADLRARRVVERLLADPVNGPGRETKAMVAGYVAGVERYLRSVGGPAGVRDPECRGAAYLRQRVTSVDLWYGVYLANLLASSGFLVKEIVEADPPSPDDPGLPQVPLAADVDREALLRGLGKDPEAPFGSNATAAGADVTTTGRGMVLGNPHFPWRGRYKFAQQHLTIPGRYDVAGASLVGSPVVNIGWNRDVAWSHTVSTAYRFTPYEFPTVGPDTILTESGPQPLERRVVRIPVKQADGSVTTVEEDLYRTPVGYVLDAPALLMGWSPASVWAVRDANAEHLRTVDTFHLMAKATSVRSLLAAQDRGAGMPWVNTIAADRRGDVLYADHSVVPNVPDDLAAVCTTPVGKVLQQVAGLPGLNGALAQSACAWGDDADAARPGIFGSANLPDAVRRDWVVNANDSYWLPNPAQPLEGFAGIIGCERCERSLRTRMVYRYVLDRLAGTDGLARGRRVSPETLRASQHENRVFGAELMREGGDLAAVCEAAEVGRACDVLAAWDGRSDTTSRGNHLFEEFVRRLPTDGSIWEVPFDAADPVGTPRDLDEGNAAVVQAMADAVAELRAARVRLDAPWGSLHVAGDRGAPPLPIGGGEGTTGNANVTVSRTPLRNRDRLSPVTYGSSHVQSVAFRRDGSVLARTILTYGQSEDPRSPWSTDQTRLFGQERWVTFPFTPREVARARVSRRVLSGS